MSDTHHHWSLSVSFPFLPLIKEFCHFSLSLFRLGIPLQEYIQHQQLHTLFQEQKEKYWHLIWENFGRGREREINWFSRRRHTVYQAAVRLSSPQKTIDSEMCQSNRCRDCQDQWGQRRCFCANAHNQPESGNDLATLPGTATETQPLFASGQE